MPRHELMNKGVENALKNFGPRSQENVADPIVPVKYFSCRNGWTWYITEAWREVVKDDPSEEFIEERALGLPLNPGEKCGGIVFFAWVQGFEFEAGRVTLQEFLEANERFAPGGRGLLAVERDLHWKPIPLSKATSAFVPASPE